MHTHAHATHTRTCDTHGVRGTHTDAMIAMLQHVSATGVSGRDRRLTKPAVQDFSTEIEPENVAVFFESSHEDKGGQALADGPIIYG